jgi:predicted nucleic acid-binding protein
VPAGDAPVLAAAVQSRSEFLVTGDRTHFGHLFGHALRGVSVVTLKDALSVLSR